MWSVATSNFGLSVGSDAGVENQMDKRPDLICDANIIPFPFLSHLRSSAIGPDGSDSETTIFFTMAEAQWHFFVKRNCDRPQGPDGDKGSGPREVHVKSSPKDP